MITVLFFLILLPLSSFCQDGFFPGSPKPTKDRVSYGFSAASAQRTHRLSGRKLIINNEKRQLLLFTKNELVNLDTQAFVPDKVGSIDLGLSFNRSYSDRQNFGLLASFGSASNKPFHSWQEIKTNFTTFYQIESGARNSWIFSLNYSNHRGYLQGYPLPGAAYFYKSPAESFQAMIGIPFFISWEFQKNYIFMTSLLFPYLASAEISVFDFMPLKLRSGFRWEYKDYLVANRPQKKQSLYADQKSVFLSAGMPLTRNLSFDLVGAYAWDRRLFIAEGFFKKSKPQYTRLSDGLQASLDLNAVF